MVITLGEKIDEALVKGQLNWHQVNRIVQLMDRRLKADQAGALTDVQAHSNEVRRILDRCSASMGERLSAINDSR